MVCALFFTQSSRGTHDGSTKFYFHLVCMNNIFEVQVHVLCVRAALSLSLLPVVYGVVILFYTFQI